MSITGYAAYSGGVNNISVFGILTCNASGYPVVAYQWRWNDGVVDQFANGSILQVNNIGLRNYTCTAMNAVGNTSATSAIAVTGLHYYVAFCS